MAAKITTQFGHAVPPATRHSITVHMPQWHNIEKWVENAGSIIAGLKNVYPRMKPHRDIAMLSSIVLERFKIEGKACLLFSSVQSAQECIEYAISPKRDNPALDKKPVLPEDISIRAFKAKDYFYAVIFPPESARVLSSFWTTPGVGVSSRFAEANLEAVDQLLEVDLSTTVIDRSNFDATAHKKIRQRIIHYLNRAALEPERQPRPTESDVYFFPTGMASIYKPHTYLSKVYNGTTVLFGMAFMNTVVAFEEFGAGSKFFGLGTDGDITALEVFLQEEHTAGRKVQAIWAEFPANPILVTPDLVRLRAIADKYDIILVMDDTLRSYANLDITHMTDMLVTSLTKSFNGYADAMAGGVVLNPASKKYSELKSLFAEHYIPELYSTDADTIEHNSRDYLIRSAKLNHNAHSLVTFLQSYAEDPTSAVRKIHYPSLNPSGEHYKLFMRRPTPDFTPGYGCLFNIEFEDIESTKTFYDTLNIHSGPHLGAPFTLAFAYTMCAYGTRLEWVEQYGLLPTQIRISAGLEDTALLIEEFRVALAVVDEGKRRRNA